MKLQGEGTSSNKLQKYGKRGNRSVCLEKAVSLQVARSSLAAPFLCGFVWQKEADRVASLPNDLHLTFTL